MHGWCFRYSVMPQPDVSLDQQLRCVLVIPCSPPCFAETTLFPCLVSLEAISLCLRPVCTYLALSGCFALITGVEKALWFADFVQTFPAEVRAIWSRSLKGPSTLFILNRYSFLGYLILRLIVGEAKPPTASGYIYIRCSAALQVTIDNVSQMLAA